MGALALATSAFGQADEQSMQDAALAATREIVECTLENGITADCASYTVKYLPDSLEIGPFCPATLDDEGGIWHWDGDKTGLYRIDGNFLRMLEAQGYTFFQRCW